MASLTSEHPSLAADLLSSLTQAAAAGGSTQERWTLWLWDEDRPCVGARYVAGHDTALGGDTWVILDRPCAWQLPFFCIREETVMAAGLTSASAWYSTSLAGPSGSALQPSPYAAGPEGSGLALTSSGLVLGDPSPDMNLTLPYDDTDPFWARGPVVSGLFRAGPGKLLALRLLREADVASAWAQYRRQPLAASGAMGSTDAGFDEGPPYEMYNVGPYKDYVIAVQGCFRDWEVETLVLITRTGRRLQLGRGGCTHRFREDAPPGGYLAGVRGRFLDPGVVAPARELLALRRTELAWIRQMKVVWAAPPGAGLPAFNVWRAARTVQAPEACPDPSFAGCFRSCPGGGYRGAVAVSTSVVKWVPGMPIDYAPPTVPGFAALCTTMANTIYTCPSNACCGVKREGLFSDLGYHTCNTTSDSCQSRCYGAFGACLVPERQLLQFVSSASADAVSSLDPAVPYTFVIKTDGPLSYADATSFCTKLGHLGLNWILPTPQDVLGWASSAATRHGAHEAITSTGYVWVSEDGVSSAPQRPTCLVAAYGLASGRDARVHQFSVSPCTATASVVCRASTSQTLASTAAGSETAAAGVSWHPGPHTLSVSQALGSGPYAYGACKDTLGAFPLTSFGNGSLVPIPTQYDILYRISSIRISHAVQMSNTTDPVTALTAIGMTWEGEGDGGVTPPPPPMTAGEPSSGVWEELRLGGEVVVAVHGCHGGFLERLVLVTNKGRLLTPPYTAASLCSAPFSLTAPPGGYLVGLQASSGEYLESVRLIWGVPQAAPVVGSVNSPSLTAPPPVASPGTPLTQTTRPPAAPGVDLLASGAALGAAPGSGSGSGDSGMVVAAAVGVAVGGVAALLAVAGAAVYLRRRRAKRRSVGEHSGPGQQGSGPAGGAQAGVSLDAAGGAASNGGKANKAARAEAELEAVTVCVAGNGSTDSHTTEALFMSTLAGTGSADADASLGVAPGVAPCHISDVERKLATYIRLQRASCEQYQDGKDVQVGSKDLAATLAQTEVELSRLQQHARVLCVLGRGSFGVVYLCRWRGLLVAVKNLVVHDELLGAQGRQRQRAILEAAISKSMHHPNVVATYAADVLPLAPQAPATLVGAPPAACDVYKLFIIQEHCDVGSLRRCIDAGVVDSAAAGAAALLCALSLALDVACGMSHIHSQSIVHGDLSAGNVLLSSSAAQQEGKAAAAEGGVGAKEEALAAVRGVWRPPVVAKVADFGLSVHMGEEQTHASNRFQGTPLYTAPEVRLYGKLSKAADVWSYGVLLLELCHGEGIAHVRARAELPAAAPPLALGGNQSPLLGTPTAQRRDWTQPPPNTPPALTRLVGWCLTPDPSQRPSFAQVVDELAGMLGAEQASHRFAAYKDAA